MCKVVCMNVGRLCVCVRARACICAHVCSFQEMIKEWNTHQVPWSLSRNITIISENTLLSGRMYQLSQCPILVSVRVK